MVWQTQFSFDQGHVHTAGSAQIWLKQRKSTLNRDAPQLPPSSAEMQVIPQTEARIQDERITSLSRVFVLQKYITSK